MKIILIISILALHYVHDRFKNQLKIYTASGAALQQQMVSAQSRETNLRK
jgi:hypothetical protein